MITHHTPENVQTHAKIVLNGKQRSLVTEAWTFGPFMVARMISFDESSKKHVMAGDDLHTHFRAGFGRVIVEAIN